ncbi:unnamed protein product, partial [Meganyctiphanes norvegica]
IFFKMSYCNTSDNCPAKDNTSCALYNLDNTLYREALGPWYWTLVVIGFAVTLALYGLFCESILYSRRNVHRAFRRHIYWITSVYPFMALMSTIPVIVPEANEICNAVKVTYMCTGIAHFTDLTLLMFGSEEAMLRSTEGSPMNLDVGPAFCCLPCLPKPPITKRSNNIVLYLCYQLPFTQAMYYITVIILLSNGKINIGNMSGNSTYVWLQLLNFFSFGFGVYALNMLAYLAKGHLEHYTYEKKSMSLRYLVLVTKLQSFALDIMGNYGVFPCIGCIISSRITKQTVENGIYLAEMLVLGIFTYYQYHQKEFDKASHLEVFLQNDPERIPEAPGRTALNHRSDKSHASTSTNSSIIGSCFVPEDETIA